MKNLIIKFFKSSLKILSVIILITFVLFLLNSFINISYLDPIDSAFSDLDFYDIYFSKIKEPTIQEDFVIVNIGFLDREGIANQLDIINRANPKAVGIVAYFNFRDSMFDYKTQMLLNSLNNTKNLVLAYNYLFDNNLNHCLNFKNKIGRLIPEAKIGFGTFSVDNRNNAFRTVRNFTPYVAIPDTFYSFAAEITRIIDKDAFDYLMSRKNEEEVINYTGNFKNTEATNIETLELYRFKKYSGFKVIDENEIFNEDFDYTIFENKIVLLGHLGYTFKGKIISTEDDIFFTPQNDIYLGRSYPDMNAVLIQANIINMILTKKYITYASDFVNIILLIFFSVLTILICWKIEDSERFSPYYDIISKFAAFFIAIVFYILFLIIMNAEQIMFDIPMFLIYIALTPDVVEIHKSLMESNIWLKIKKLIRIKPKN